MKKNLLAIIILALVIVNLAMTGFMMLSVMTTNSQTAKLISDIAGALELEANGGNTGGFSGSASGNVAVTDLAVFNLAGDDEMMINLKPSDDGSSHIMVVDIVFSMNTASPDYATMGTEEKLTSMKELMKSKVNDVISAHSMEEIQADTEGIQTEILEAIQELFGSNFIYSVSFSKVIFS